LSSRHEGVFSPCPLCLTAKCARMGGLGQAHTQVSLGLFPLGASRAKGRAPTRTKSPNAVAKATPHNQRWKRGWGLCEGGLRRHFKANHRHS